jgi:Carboxypeptidase regulatory-like domain
MKISTTRLNGSILLIWLILPFCKLWAQSHINTGAIRVAVTDEAGATLAGADVTLTHTDTGAQRTITTSSKGIVEAPLLSVGTYDVVVQKSGFSPVKQTGILVKLGQLQVLNFQLKVGAVTTVVEVSKPAPNSDASRFEMSFLVDSAMVSGLPINGRRFADLALLSPGIMQEIERNQLSISGARGINSSINLDGLEFTEPFFGGQRGGERSSLAYTVSQEAVQEFQVVRGNAAAEFGRGTGGVINVITKSGANDFHGSAFYYLRHRELAPRDALGDDRAPTRQQFGGSLGGPIV